MGLLYSVTCDRCSASFTLEQKLRVYSVSGSAPIGVEATPAWCHACARVVEAELFDSVRSLEDQITRIRFRHPEAPTFDDLLGLTPEEELKGLEERLAWRRGRVSPPKCLECGGASIEFFTALRSANPSDAGQIGATHPACGGRLTARATGHRDDAGSPIRYGAEGSRES